MPTSPPAIEEVARLGAEVQDFYLRPVREPAVPHPDVAADARQPAARAGDPAPRRGRLRHHPRAPTRGGPGDLLSILLLARDEHGVGMSERQVRDEVMTLLLAGHETTALALTWAFLLLDRNPEARAVSRRSSAAVLGDAPRRARTMCRAAVHPGGRQRDAAALPAGVRHRPRGGPRHDGRRSSRIPKGHIVLISMYATHRDPRFYPDPDAFRPERWLDGLEKRLPRGAFIPFGLGSRKCIGASFAMMEATLLLATIARRWRFELVAGRDPDPSVDHPPARGGHARANAIGRPGRRMTTVRVAAVQATYVLMDRDATIDRVAELTADAAAQGAQLVVFPEVFVPGTPIWIDTQPIWDGDADWFRLLAENAVVVPGPATDRLGAIAREHGVWLVIGVEEREPERRDDLQHAALLLARRSARREAPQARADRLRADRLGHGRRLDAACRRHRRSDGSAG